MFFILFIFVSLVKSCVWFVELEATDSEQKLIFPCSESERLQEGMNVECFWNALQSVTPKRWRFTEWRSNVMLPVTTHSCPPPHWLAERRLRLFFLSFLLLLLVAASTAAIVICRLFSMPCGTCWLAICALPISALRLFEQTDAAVNKHHPSEGCAPQPRLLNGAAPEDQPGGCWTHDNSLLPPECGV